MKTPPEVNQRGRRQPLPLRLSLRQDVLQPGPSPPIRSGADPSRGCHRHHVSAGFFIAGGPALRGAAGCGAATALGFGVLALPFFFFFFLSAADLDLSSRNSALSSFICFFSAFLRASTCLLAMSIPRRWL